MIHYKIVKLEEGVEEGHCNIPSEKMMISRIAVGAPGDDSHPELLKPALFEFISMVIFVFAGEGSTMAFCKLTEGDANTQDNLVATALARAFAPFVAVSVGANISGGHVNPAVTFGAYVGGNINLIRLRYYWAAQLLGFVVACILLKMSTGGLNTAAFTLSSDVSVWSALVLEIIMTFGLVYTVYATETEPNKGEIRGIAPLAVGFIAGVNILAGAAFDGASMNPAVSFGPALVSWTWSHHWVYWLGPLIGGGAAALIYDKFLISDPSHEPLHRPSEHVSSWSLVSPDHNVSMDVPHG